VPKLPRADVPELAAKLGAILLKPADYATGKDDSGRKTVTFSLRELPGIGLAEFIGYRGKPEAWRFELDSMRCTDVAELGLEVVEVSRGDGRPLSAGWYRVRGGPLDGARVKVYPARGQGLCNVLPGTQDYWKLAGETPP
jgi:hypothetical protein